MPRTKRLSVQLSGAEYKALTRSLTRELATLRGLDRAIAENLRRKLAIAWHGTVDKTPARPVT